MYSYGMQLPFPTTVRLHPLVAVTIAHMWFTHFTEVIIGSDLTKNHDLAWVGAGLCHPQ